MRKILEVMIYIIIILLVIYLSSFHTYNYVTFFSLFVVSYRFGFVLKRYIGKSVSKLNPKPENNDKNKNIKKSLSKKFKNFKKYLKIIPKEEEKNL